MNERKHVVKNLQDESMKLLKDEMEDLDQKILFYQSELIKLGWQQTSLKVQEKWLQECSQKIQNDLKVTINQKEVYQSILGL